ncbi:SNF2-related protein [Penicillium samsonianum]|uniref:SNF2-related protein n=1 Tax=Penicillium samsonianum TaxID=1882272 RepID=UPI002549BCEE|nr:SNF2-related protein [Penicillium samsonianum]KAJ6133204.1 SNF2-related protein [Penicillium samsonianum]
MEFAYIPPQSTHDALLVFSRCLREQLLSKRKVVDKLDKDTANIYRLLSNDGPETWNIVIEFYHYRDDEFGFADSIESLQIFVHARLLNTRRLSLLIRLTASPLPTSNLARSLTFAPSGMDAEC